MKKLTKWLGNNSEGIKSISHLYGNKEASIQAAVNPSFPQKIQSNPKEAHTNALRTTLSQQVNKPNDFKKQNLSSKRLMLKSHLKHRGHYHDSENESCK